jgi:hypothetical protein
MNFVEKFKKNNRKRREIKKRELEKLSKKRKK